MSKTLSVIQHFTRGIVPGFLFVCSLTACKNDPKQIDALVNKNNLQEDKAYDVTFIQSEHGKVKARVFAKEFISNEVAKPPFTDLKNGIKVEFFDDSLQVETILTAQYARLYDQQNNVILRDSVKVVNKKNEQLKTQELIWNQKVRKFYTEKFVQIYTPTQIMYGDGLEANEDFSWYEIKHPKGIVQVDKTELPE
jgi:LPS export ABC transporter protein LptC